LWLSFAPYTRTSVGGGKNGYILDENGCDQGDGEAETGSPNRQSEAGGGEEDRARQEGGTREGQDGNGESKAGGCQEDGTCQGKAGNGQGEADGCEEGCACEGEDGSRQGEAGCCEEDGSEGQTDDSAPRSGHESEACGIRPPQRLGRESGSTGLASRDLRHRAALLRRLALRRRIAEAMAQFVPLVGAKDLKGLLHGDLLDRQRMLAGRL